MRNLCAFVTVLMMTIAAVPAAAADSATSNVTVHVSVSSRTSLHVSSDLLHFAIDRDRGTATTSVDFVAGARLPSGSDLVLSVEPVSAIDGPGGAADAETEISIDGEGDAIAGGTLATVGPTIAARWHGSGRRTGHLVFTLHASAAGDYELPVRFVLSTP
jgi:hypothetical protein